MVPSDGFHLYDIMIDNEGEEVFTMLVESGFGMPVIKATDWIKHRNYFGRAVNSTSLIYFFPGAYIKKD